MIPAVPSEKFLQNCVACGGRAWSRGVTERELAAAASADWVRLDTTSPALVAGFAMSLTSVSLMGWLTGAGKICAGKTFACGRDKASLVKLVVAAREAGATLAAREAVRPGGMGDWIEFDMGARIGRSVLPPNESFAESGDGCMRCFVRGYMSCEDHKRDAVTADQLVADRLAKKPLPRVYPEAAPLEPGWDACMQPGGTYQYVRSDGCLVFSEQDRWRIEHPQLGMLGDYSHKDPVKLMKLADKKIPAGGVF